MQSISLDVLDKWIRDNRIVIDGRYVHPSIVHFDGECISVSSYEDDDLAWKISESFVDNNGIVYFHDLVSRRRKKIEFLNRINPNI